MANLETLSCVEVKMPPSGGYTAQEAVVRPVVEQQTYPTAYGNLQYPSQNVGGGIQQQYSTTASAPAIYSFLPLSTLSAAPNNNNILPPNTSPNTYYYQQLKKVFQELSQNPHQQVKKLLAGLYSIGNNLTSSTSTAAVDGQQQQQQYGAC
jgi:hypothetical protein